MDFDEECFFAAKNYDIIIKVKEIREGNAEDGAEKVEGIDVWSNGQNLSEHLYF